MKPFPRTGSARTGLIAAALCALLAGSTGADAQIPPIPMPIPTTLVITKLAPDQIYADRQVVTMGVGAKMYKFVLKDAYVDASPDQVRWPDIWQQVRQHRPNFHVVGIGDDIFAKIEPGRTLTVRGMYTPLNRNFEVIGTEEGAGEFAPGTHY